MKGRVEIRAGVRDHLDLADVKLGAGRITSVRIFAPQMIANHRRGQAFVGNHAVFNAVTDVYQFELTCHRSSSTAFGNLNHVSAPALENSTPCLLARSSPAHRSSDETYPPGFRSALIPSAAPPATPHATETCPAK